MEYPLILLRCKSTIFLPSARSMYSMSMDPTQPSSKFFCPKPIYKKINRVLNYKSHYFYNFPPYNWSFFKNVMWEPFLKVHLRSPKNLRNCTESIFKVNMCFCLSTLLVGSRGCVANTNGIKLEKIQQTWFFSPQYQCKVQTECD